MKDLTLEKAIEAWLQLQPLSEDDRNRLSRKFTVDFNYNSNHIEGNTLTVTSSRRENLSRIQFGQNLPTLPPMGRICSSAFVMRML